MIIAEYDFVVNQGFETLSAKYPQLVDSSFLMDLNTSSGRFLAEVTINQVYEDLDIAIYNGVEELIQPKIYASEGQNLFYFEDYYLFFYPDLNKFVFGKFD